MDADTAATGGSVMFFFDPNSALLGIAAARLEANAERRQEEHRRQTMTPEEFATFKAERDAERRHREICHSIEKAGENARFRLW